MKIKVLGTRGEVEGSKTGHSKHSGVLIDGKILVDLGEEEFLKEKPELILITHLHPDHAAFVRKMFAIKATVMAPEKYKEMPIRMMKKEIKIAGGMIRPIPTDHSTKVKSCAYLIKRGGKRILYTGDMIWIKKKYWGGLKNLDLVITEGSFVREGGRISRQKITGKIYGHAGIPDLLRFFTPFTKKILLVHFGGWFYKDVDRSKKKLVELGEKYGLEMSVGYDGMELEI